MATKNAPKKKAPEAAAKAETPKAVSPEKQAAAKLKALNKQREAGEVDAYHYERVIAPLAEKFENGNRDEDLINQILSLD